MDAEPTPSPAPNDADTRASAPSSRPPDGSLRETIESIIFAFILAFTFRAFVVEAFVIPTGSMAPTLLGEHLSLRCPRCGYHFNVDHRHISNKAPCPMCDFPIPTSWPLGPHDDPMPPRPVAGDRILVLKYLYLFQEPKRWEVVVFKNPQMPDQNQYGALQNYIKRLVGLPGEELKLVDGNVYTRPLAEGFTPPSPDTPWTIQRKPEHVQRVLWQPIYDSAYFPLDGGENALDDRPGRRERRWQSPWRPVDPSDTASTASGWTHAPRSPHWHYRDAQGRPGLLDFAFSRETQQNQYAYNMGSGEDSDHRTVREFRLAATVTAESKGLGLTLTCGGQGILGRARMHADGRVQLQTRPRDGAWQTRTETRIAPLGTRPRHVELWNVDQSLSLWIEGQRVAQWSWDLSDVGLNLDTLEGGDRSEMPVASIEVAGAPVTLRSIQLDRDLYYTQYYSQPVVLGTSDHPVIIGKDQYYCLGDNSPQSRDSRLWQNMDPWVKDLTRDRYHHWRRDGPRPVQVPGLQVGLVPRELMIGKAFFVYWPAAHRLFPHRADLLGSLMAVPNFGQMRFIR